MLPLDAQHLTRKELEYLAGPSHLGNGLGQGLPFLAGKQGSQLLPAQEYLGADEIKRICTLLGAFPGPVRLRLLGSSNGGQRVIRGCLGVKADKIASVRGAEILADIDAVRPLPCN
ncbi:hypothetical protein D9M70_627210 [compost metagenome]